MTLVINSLISGGSSYSTSAGRGSTNVAPVSGSNADPFTGSSSYTSQQPQEPKFYPQSVFRTFDMGDPNVILTKIKEFNKKNGTLMEEPLIEQAVNTCSNLAGDAKSIDLLFQLLNWPEGS